MAQSPHARQSTETHKSRSRTAEENAKTPTNALSGRQEDRVRRGLRLHCELRSPTFDRSVMWKTPKRCRSLNGGFPMQCPDSPGPSKRMGYLCTAGGTEGSNAIRRPIAYKDASCCCSWEVR